MVRATKPARIKLPINGVVFGTWHSHPRNLILLSKCTLSCVLHAQSTAFVRWISLPSLSHWRRAFRFQRRQLRYNATEQLMSTCFSRILCLHLKSCLQVFVIVKAGNCVVFPASVWVWKSDIWVSLSKIDCVPSEDRSHLTPYAVPTSFEPKRYVVLTRNCLKDIIVV